MMSGQLGQFCKQLGTQITSHAATKMVVSALGAFFAYFLGMEAYAGVEVLTFLCVLDVLFAFYVLHKKGKSISSNKLPKKAFDLFVYVLLIGTVNLFDKTSTFFGSYLVDGMIVWFSATEALSILEHASEIGYKVPWSILRDIKKIKTEV